MKRRNFIQLSFGVGAAFALENLSEFFPSASAAEEPSIEPSELKMVAVQGGERVEMLSAAITAMGGMSRFVKPGQSVVLKPNASWDKTPELAANTHPSIVAHVIKLCLDAGAKEVVVFDHCCDAEQLAYASSGIADAVKAAGGTMLSGADKSLYREVEIKGARKLPKAAIHSAILDADVYINIPVLKHHGGAGMTACMKNAMGIVWDRLHYHHNDLHQCIAETQMVRMPELNILDAYSPMLRNGPKGKDINDLVEMKTMLLSTDIVAIDTAASKMLGNQDGDVRHIDCAAALGMGEKNLSRVPMRRISMPA